MVKKDFKASVNIFQLSMSLYDDNWTRRSISEIQYLSIVFYIQHTVLLTNPLKHWFVVFFDHSEGVPVHSQVEILLVFYINGVVPSNTVYLHVSIE